MKRKKIGVKMCVCGHKEEDHNDLFGCMFTIPPLQASDIDWDCLCLKFTIKNQIAKQEADNGENK